MRRATLLGCLALVGCVKQPAPHVEPGLTEWARTRATLAAMRRELPPRPYVAQVSVTMREPRSGRAFDGRGAVAVDRARGVRMILVGPGGATALDAWVTRDRWRFAVPAVGIVRKGTTRDGAPGLPVGFFRWWFVAPLDGQLLTSIDDGRAKTWVLRDGDATSELAIGEKDELLDIHARRRERDHDERLAWRGRSLMPHPGDGGAYADAATGLALDIHVDSVSDEPPPAEAFDDPETAP